jgi:hypothetical protein
MCNCRVREFSDPTTPVKLESSLARSGNRDDIAPAGLDRVGCLQLAEPWRDDSIADRIEFRLRFRNAFKSPDRLRDGRRNARCLTERLTHVDAQESDVDGLPAVPNSPELERDSVRVRSLLNPYVGSSGARRQGNARCNADHPGRAMLMHLISSVPFSYIDASLS